MRSCAPSRSKLEGVCVCGLLGGRAAPLWKTLLTTNHGQHECYAFRRAVERYYEYLTAQRFIVWADSEPLVWLQTLRRPRGRMAEWILELQPLNYEVGALDRRIRYLHMPLVRPLSGCA